jgi:hypothetical protein
MPLEVGAGKPTLVDGERSTMGLTAHIAVNPTVAPGAPVEWGYLPSKEALAP